MSVVVLTITPYFYSSRQTHPSYTVNEHKDILQKLHFAFLPTPFLFKSRDNLLLILVFIALAPDLVFYMTFRSFDSLCSPKNVVQHSTSVTSIFSSFCRFSGSYITHVTCSCGCGKLDPCFQHGPKRIESLSI